MMSKVILGGGLGGLSAAYYLRKKFQNQLITLIESSSRTGGWIRSEFQDDGTIFEQGPRTIRPKGLAAYNTLQLIEELDLTNEITPIFSNHPAARNRMIYVNGGLHLLPNSLLGLFTKQDPFSKPLILHFLKEVTQKSKKVDDESIYDFAERRFGKEVADYLISPMICGICAGNAQQISVNFLMEKLFNYEQTHGSITSGIIRNLFRKNGDIGQNNLAIKAKNEKWSIFSFKNGCETLPLALQSAILKDNVKINLNSKCTQVEFTKHGAILQLNGKEEVQTDHLISSLSSERLSQILTDQHPDLKRFLDELTKNVSVAVINLKFKGNVIKDPAFGLLVAPVEKLPILGVIFDSCCFPKNNSTILTVMMGGFWFEKYFGKNPSEEQLFNIAMSNIRKILKIDVEPDMYKVRILPQCLPQYVVGHNQTLQKIKDYIETKQLPISLCGASYTGVGINDVILSARKAIQEIQ